MEESQIRHRIRFYQYLRDTYRQYSGNNSRSLVEILNDHTFGMTHDELRKFMLDTLAPSLEKAWKEHDVQAARAEEARREAELEREARKSADREKTELRKEIERLRKELEDAKNTKATDNRNRFGSSSRKTRHSVDKNFDRTDNLFSHVFHRGAEASCIICSLVETCRLRERYVREFFHEYFMNLVSGRTDCGNLIPCPVASQG